MSALAVIALGGCYVGFLVTVLSVVTAAGRADDAAERHAGTLLAHSEWQPPRSDEPPDAGAESVAR